MSNKASLLFFLAMILSHASWSSLDPDNQKEHCRAFDGHWRDGKCLDRLEFQQRPVKTNFAQSDQIQWCQSRNGVLVSTSRGKRCKRAQSEQGLQKYPLPIKSKERFTITKDVFNSCIENDLVKKASCEVRATRTHEWFDYTGDTAPIPTSAAVIMSNILIAANSIRRNNNGVQERKFLISSLKDYIHKNDLNSCQKACLVKCASSRVLKYKPTLNTKYGGISQMYDNRTGVCTEYSSVAIDLGKALDIPVTRASSLNHSYNYFQIMDMWYTGEPQNASCTFYHTEQSLNRYQILLSGGADKAYDGSRMEMIENPIDTRVSRKNPASKDQ